MPHRSNASFKDSLTRWAALVSFVLSVSQAAGLLLAAAWPPSIEVLKPSHINFWCQAAINFSNVKADPVPCGTPGSPDGTVVLADAFAYFNATFGRNAVVEREIATLTLLRAAKSPGQYLDGPNYVLEWQRIKTAENWNVTTVQNIDANRAVSHTTAFLPPSPQDGALPWKDFAQDVIDGKWAGARLNFTVILHGRGTVRAAPACVVAFVDRHRKKLARSLAANADGKAKLDAAKLILDKNPDDKDAKALREAGFEAINHSYPYLSLPCA